jgi:hypothetical protein
MIIWINGAFGSGKTTAASELRRRVKNSCVYDPENAGYFIRKNAPEEAGLNTGDFQDISLWREINYKMLKLIADNYDGLVIVPMTLVNPEYYQEIIVRLRADGIKIRHFILYAGEETLVKNLKKRSLSLKRESFAVDSIGRCIYAFDNYITEEKIFVDNKNIDEIVAEIALRAFIKLEPDSRFKIKKIFDRFFTFVRHIR